MDRFSFEEFSLFLSALKFSAEQHRNQRRKDVERSPYLNHPIEVAELLYRVGGVRELPVLTAAILHDIVEDTDVSPDEMRALFGEEVVSLVLQVSDDKRLPKAERKERQVQEASQLSRGAKLIKIADKICNIRDVTYSPPANWPFERRMEYLNWAEKVVEGLRGCNGALEEHFHELLRRCRDSLKAQETESSRVSCEG